MWTNTSTKDIDEPIDFDKAWELYQQYEDRNLSFTDCTNIALMERLNIETLFTFDTGFKGLVTMIAELPG